MLQLFDQTMFDLLLIAHQEVIGSFLLIALASGKHLIVVLKVNYLLHQMAITLAEKGFLEKKPEKLNDERQLRRDDATMTAMNANYIRTN